MNATRTTRAKSDAPEAARSPPVAPGDEPRWLALVALVAVGGLYAALPDSLSVVPGWVLPAAVGCLLVPTVWTHRTGRHSLNHKLGIAANAVITVALVSSVALLVRALPARRVAAEELLRAAAALWATNILVFALWYWRLDAGGPHLRDRRAEHRAGAFLFPQMAMSEETRQSTNQSAWSPRFLDYLFLAFNTSTALSPTDAAPLSGWAKAAMMAQSAISLTILALLAARAVNVL